MKPFIKAVDIAIIFTAAALCAFSFFSAYISPRGNLQIFIRSRDGEWIFQPGSEETLTVRGPLGDTVIRISGTEVWIESSPCENQTCISTGMIGRAGQWAACLPNNVLVLIKGSNADNVDAVAW